MKATLRITKAYVQDHIRQPAWAIYVQQSKNRWYHLPTLNRANLKDIAQQHQGKELNVSDPSIWKRVDCTCSRCDGRKLDYHKPPANSYETKLQWGPEPCPRCAGKGYETVSDEQRFAQWINYNWAQQA